MRWIGALDLMSFSTRSTSPPGYARQGGIAAQSGVAMFNRVAQSFGID